MLNLETFKVVVKSTSNGGLFIKVGDYKVPYDVSSQMDYMGQASKYVESTLGLTVIGFDFTTIVATKQAVKFTELFKFDQLSEKAKEKVISDYKTEVSFMDDFLLDSLTELCGSLGFYDTDIEYSLDYSHRPFAKLNGLFKKPSNEVLDALMADYGDLEVQKIIGLIKSLPDDFIVADYNGFEDVFLNIVKLVNDFLLQSFEVEYAYQQSDDFIAEDVTSNDYYFDVDGNFVQR